MLAVDATAHARQRRELDRLMPCRPETRAWTARTARTSSSQALMQEERRSAVPVHADCAIHTCHPRQLRGVGGGITTARRNIDAGGGDDEDLAFQAAGRGEKEYLPPAPGRSRFALRITIYLSIPAIVLLEYALHNTRGQTCSELPRLNAVPHGDNMATRMVELVLRRGRWSYSRITPWRAYCSPITKAFQAH